MSGMPRPETLNGDVFGDAEMERTDTWLPSESVEEDQHIGTPEHWCDVGPLHAHVTLMDQQLRMLQAQMADTNRQLAQMTQCMQQLDLQVSMQKQQHQEDIVKIMATQAMTLSNLSLSQQVAPPRAKARPGPRERQRMREKEEDETRKIDCCDTEVAEFRGGHDSEKTLDRQNEEIHVRQDKQQSNHHSKQPFVEETKLREGQVAQEHRSEGKIEVEPQRLERKPQRTFDSVPLSSWVSLMVILLLMMHVALGDPKGWAFRDGLTTQFGCTWPVQAGLEATKLPRRIVARIIADQKPMVFNSTRFAHTIQDAPLDDMIVDAQQGSRRDANNEQTSSRMRELGHLQLSVSDCIGAESWFSRALKHLDAESSAQRSTAFGNESSFTEKDRAILQGDRGFALVCAHRYKEGADALEKVLHARHYGVGVNSPHLLNALGYAHFKLRDYIRAKEVFEAVLKSHPENPVLWNNLGAASMSAGDIPTADDALYYAISKSSQLRQFTQAYYRQVFSNNVHVLRQRSQDRYEYLPAVEIFNCMISEVRTVVASKGPEDFQKTYETVAKVDKASIEPSKLMHSRSSVLALEQEPLFCP